MRSSSHFLPSIPSHFAPYHSSHLYHMFDQVMVLAQGELLYYGPGGVAPAHYFAARGLPCQEGYNVADHLLDIASDKRAGEFTTGSASSAVGGGVGGYLAPVAHYSGDLSPIAVTPDLEKGGSGAGSRPGSGSKESAGVHTATLPKSQPQSRPPVAGAGARAGGSEASFETLVPRTKYATTFLTQVQVLSGREWKNLRRDKTLFLTHTVVAAVLGVFCGGLYYKVRVLCSVPCFVCVGDSNFLSLVFLS